jgi:hypothetical protein
MDAVCYVKK